MPARIILAITFAALLAVAGYFLQGRNTPAPAPAPVAAETPAPSAPPQSQPPAPLEKPRLWKLANDVPCLDAQPYRFENAPAKIFPEEKPIGILLINNCEEPQSINDIKYSKTALEYVSSRLPEPVAIFHTSDTVTPEIRTLSRRSQECMETDLAPNGACGFIALSAPGQRLFIALPDQSWFLIKANKNQKITGFSGLPQDPSQPRPVPKMPDMGFKIKGVGKN